MKVMALLLEKSPDINSKICFGKVCPYEEVNISVLCDVNNGEVLFI